MKYLLPLLILFLSSCSVRIRETGINEDTFYSDNAVWILSFTFVCIINAAITQNLKRKADMQDEYIDKLLKQYNRQSKLIEDLTKKLHNMRFDL